MKSELAKNYDEEIELVISNIDMFDEGIGEDFYNEWNDVKNEVEIAKEKYKDNDFFKDKAIENLKKKFLKKILECEENEPEYDYYKIVLEFLGIDEYVLDSELQEIKQNKKINK